MGLEAGTGRESLMKRGRLKGNRYRSLPSSLPGELGEQTLPASSPNAVPGVEEGGGSAGPWNGSEGHLRPP